MLIIIEHYYNLINMYILKLNICEDFYTIFIFNDVIYIIKLIIIVYNK